MVYQDIWVDLIDSGAKLDQKPSIIAFLYVSQYFILHNHCRQFYGFDDTFDSTLFMVRSKESEKKRNIYLSAKSMKDVALCNERRMKVSALVAM